MRPFCSGSLCSPFGASAARRRRVEVRGALERDVHSSYSEVTRWRLVRMAKLIFGMSQSLDGYVDHDHKDFIPCKVLFRHFIEQVRSESGIVYGSRIYEIMRYWDEDKPEWDDAEREFANVWRKKHKWVVSNSLKSVGPNATLAADGLESLIRKLKTELDGEFEIAGPVLAGSATELGLIDEYRIYLHPVVIGGGKPFFTGPRPRLRLVAQERIGADVIRLTFVPD